MADGAQQRIKLSTVKGLIGYKINKFQIFPNTPGHTTSYESTVQVFTTERTTAIPTTGAIVNFDDPTLLGVAYYQDHVDAAYPASVDVIFESVKFNQDIYIVHTSGTSSGVDASINFYLELEQFMLSEDEATVATLKDMRGRE